MIADSTSFIRDTTLLGQYASPTETTTNITLLVNSEGIPVCIFSVYPTAPERDQHRNTQQCSDIVVNSTDNWNLYLRFEENPEGCSVTSWCYSDGTGDHVTATNIPVKEHISEWLGIGFTHIAEDMPMTSNFSRNGLLANLTYNTGSWFIAPWLYSKQFLTNN